MPGLHVEDLISGVDDTEKLVAMALNTNLGSPFNRSSAGQRSSINNDSSQRNSCPLSQNQE